MDKAKINKTQAILNELPIKAAYLYGSEVNGKTGALSDIDIAVLLKEEFDENKYLNLRLKLINKISDVVKPKEADVIILNESPPLLKYSAVIKGKRIYTLNKLETIKFEERVLKEYEDTKYLRQTYYQHLEKRVEENRIGEPIYE
jgi:predicted nucleotidyltransferase